MKQLTTGLAEVMLILAAMAVGAGFVFTYFTVGKAVKPTEAAIWGIPDDSAGSSGSDSGTTSAVATPATTTGTTASTAASGPSAGKAIFEKNCNGCHPGGNKGVGPALSAPDFNQRYPQDADVAKVIRGGKGGIMPPFSTTAISDSDLTALIGYVKSLSGGGSSPAASTTITNTNTTTTTTTTKPAANNPAPTSTPTVAPAANASSASTGDATAGKAVFEKNCTGCHPGGNKGVGPALSAPDFSQRYPQDADVAKVVRGGKGGIMPPFSTSTVSDSDLANLIAFVRSLSGGASSGQGTTANTSTGSSNSSGSSSNGSTNAGSGTSGTSSAPSPSPTATPAPLAKDGPGKTVFDSNCGVCHPGGNKGAGPALNTADFKQRYPQDSDIAAVVRNGDGGKHAVYSTTALSDSDLQSIIGYIRSLLGG